MSFFFFNKLATDVGSRGAMRLFFTANFGL